MEDPHAVLEAVSSTEFSKANESYPNHSARDRRSFLSKLNHVVFLFSKLGYSLKIHKTKSK